MKPSIHSLLQKAGVSNHYRGYRYFIRSVELGIARPERLYSIFKEIYTLVAAEFSTSAYNVDRDIRTIRDVLMRNGGQQLLAEMTGSSKWAEKTPYPRDLLFIFCSYYRAIE